jgi:hypothetical protein
MTSTVAGIRIDCNDEQPLNVHLSICANFEPDWKPNEESDVHRLKQFSPMTSTVAGIQIDCNDEQS